LDPLTCFGVQYFIHIGLQGVLREHASSEYVRRVVSGELCSSCYRGIAWPCTGRSEFLTRSVCKHSVCGSGRSCDRPVALPVTKWPISAITRLQEQCGCCGESSTRQLLDGPDGGNASLRSQWHSERWTEGILHVCCFFDQSIDLVHNVGIRDFQLITLASIHGLLTCEEVTARKCSGRSEERQYIVAIALARHWCRQHRKQWANCVVSSGIRARVRYVFGFCPLRWFFIGPDKMWSPSAKCGLWGGWLNASSSPSRSVLYRELYESPWVS
jgi:hypothetical protein